MIIKATMLLALARLPLPSGFVAAEGHIWESRSDNGGKTWSEPRFVFANALAANTGSGCRTKKET